VAGVRCVGIDFRYWNGWIKSFWCFDMFCNFCPEGEWVRVSGGLTAFRNAAVRSFSLAHQPLPDPIRAGQFPQRIDPKMVTKTLAETLISVRGPITKADCIISVILGTRAFALRASHVKLYAFGPVFHVCHLFVKNPTCIGGMNMITLCLLLIPADSTVENRFFAVAPFGLADVKICPPFLFHVLCKLYPSAVSNCIHQPSLLAKKVCDHYTLGMIQ